MRFNIQTKLFLLLVGLTAVILFGVLFAINRTLSDRILEKVISDFKQTQRIFQKEQNLRYERLVETATLIGENSTFKANVGLNDPASVYFSVDEFASFAQVDLFIVTDRSGKVLARLGEPENYGDDLTNRGSVVEAMRGTELELKIVWPELWEVKNTLYQIVSVPIYTGEETILGTITLGSAISAYEAVELKGESQIDISFFLRDTFIGSTLDSSLMINIADFQKENHKMIDLVLSAQSAGEPFESKLGSEEVFAFISPLGLGESAYYLATVPKSLELKILTALQNNILLSAGISILITLVLAFLLGRTFSRPVLRLVEGMHQITEGNLNISVEPSTRDEIGLLTQTFNEMIVGLRERMHLMKYVGSHTIDMIQGATDGDVSLGGERKDIAVLFSDIRGFTALSENKSPEDTINLLNRYLGFQSEIVDSHKGSVDKFVGDEMVALFIGEDAIERAILCGMRIQERIKQEQEKDPMPVDVGIGINYGPVVLGNMGAQDRMDYTVIGSTVNLGSRLCTSAKGGQILIRKDLLDQLKYHVNIGQTQMMLFKGFSNELEIAEVIPG